MGEDGLDLVGHKLVLDKRRNQAGFARALVAANADPY